MSDIVSVQPTPIQRNSKDVAVELVQILAKQGLVGPDNIEELYTKFYSLAETLGRAHYNLLMDFIPAETKEKINK